MRWEERVERLMDVYCSAIEDPLERVYLKHDFFGPRARLPEAVEKIASQNGNVSSFCLRYLSKSELIEIEKDCTEALVLSKAVLNPFSIAGRVDAELKKVVSEKSSLLPRINAWTKSRFLQRIADNIWQNIFDALLDDPEVRKVRRVLFNGLFTDDKNENLSKSF